MLARSDYHAGTFTDVDAVWGERLWSFLNEPSSVSQMISASDAHRPAAEAIASDLHQRFGDAIKQTRVKQFTGFLIRQVMERNGYQHVQYRKDTRANPVFSKGSVYAANNT